MRDVPMSIVRCFFVFYDDDVCYKDEVIILIFKLDAYVQENKLRKKLQVLCCTF